MPGAALFVLLLSAPGLAQEAPPAEAPPAAPAPVAQPSQAPPGYPYPTPNGYPQPYPYPPYYPPPQVQVAPAEAPTPPTAGLAPSCKAVRLGTPKELERILGDLYAEGARDFLVVGNATVCGWR